VQYILRSKRAIENAAHDRGVLIYAGWRKKAACIVCSISKRVEIEAQVEPKRGLAGNFIIEIGRRSGIRQQFLGATSLC